MKNNQAKKNKIEVNCLKCKARFDIWVSGANFSEDSEEQVRKKLLKYCPVCAIFEERE